MTLRRVYITDLVRLLFATRNFFLPTLSYTLVGSSQWQIGSWLEKSNPKFFKSHKIPLYSCNKMITTALTTGLAWTIMCSVNFHVPQHLLHLKKKSASSSSFIPAGAGLWLPEAPCFICTHTPVLWGSDSVPTERAGKTWLVQTSVCVLEVEDKGQSSTNLSQK